jgi:hypothetical protein
LHLIVRGEQLIDGAESPTAELARYQVGASRVGIDDAKQPHAAQLLQRVIHARVVAPKCAYANDRYIDW